MSIINGAIKSLMFMPDSDPMLLNGSLEVDMLLVAVIKDRICLNEEIISAVDELVF